MKIARKQINRLPESDNNFFGALKIKVGATAGF
jgi:hypothetical protein